MSELASLMNIYIQSYDNHNPDCIQSEKVDDVTGGSRPDGSYDGLAVAMVIREMVDKPYNPNR